MDRWTEIELFVQVAETGSLSRAAETLQLSNAAASRHLAALESRLGARLVERNTRRLFLTDTGREFLSRARTIVADLRDAEAAVNATALNPTGVLRVSASLSFAMHHVAPLLRQYTQRYPNVQVHLEAANRYMDIIDNNIDVANGTIRVKARFANPKGDLWPGQFVQTRVELGVLKDALVIPADAVVTSVNGRFVYVVGEDNTVKPKPIKDVYAYKETLVVDGISAEDRIVLDGRQNLRPGGKVRIVTPAGGKK